MLEKKVELASKVSGFNETRLKAIAMTLTKDCFTDITLNTTSSLSTTFNELFPSKQSIL